MAVGSVPLVHRQLGRARKFTTHYRSVNLRGRNRVAPNSGQAIGTADLRSIGYARTAATAKHCLRTPTAPWPDPRNCFPPKAGEKASFHNCSSRLTFAKACFLTWLGEKRNLLLVFRLSFGGCFGQFVGRFSLASLACENRAQPLSVRSVGLIRFDK